MGALKTPILLVDDRRANLDALEAVFDSRDYELVSVTSGSDALDQVERREFAVVLLDLQMPSMDGIETARRMRERATRLGLRAPIIFVTAIDTDRARVLSAYQAGAVDFMQKPLEPDILRAKIAVFADLYRSRNVARDATLKFEREKTEAEEAARRFRLLVESVKDHAIFILDPKGNVATWNPGAERINGYAAAEIVGKHFSIFYPPNEAVSGRCEAELESAVREGRFEEEGWRVRKDGSPFWVNVTITTLRAPESGALIGFATVTQDLTERKIAEEEARRFRLLVESVKDYAIFILDPKGNVATWNPGAERIKGYAASEIIGKHFSVFYPPEEAASGKCDAELDIAAREGRFEEEGWRVRKDGSLLWANVTITPLRDHRGTLVGFAKVTRDLTERMQNEKMLRHLAAEKAALAEKARIQEFQERFIAILGHDLRNPLSAIDMGAAILRQRAASSSDETTTRVVDRMRASTRRMSRMIEQILDLTRSRLGGGLPVERETMSLCPMITAVVDELRVAYPSREIDLRCPSTVTGSWDRDRLEQVFSNLVSNAIHYGDPARPVTVAVEGDDGQVVVTVHNDGPHIPDALREDLFSPFRRGERDSKERETAGLGLGLYISREIVLAHGGEIDVRSTPTEGTTFRVALPREANGPPAQSAPEERR
jgi:PAS domain S-box-containing protein